MPVNELTRNEMDFILNLMSRCQVNILDDDALENCGIAKSLKEKFGKYVNNTVSTSI